MTPRSWHPAEVATWGGQQTEAYSHRHIGWPPWGTFHLQSRDASSGFEIQGIDSLCGIALHRRRMGCGRRRGQGVPRMGDYDTEIISRVKGWLTGDIADEYDLVVRTKLLGGTCAWSDPVYVHNSKDEPLTLETAPACGPEPDGSSDTKISGMNVHLIRKPTGARVVREFSAEENVEVTEEFGSGAYTQPPCWFLRLPSGTPIAYGRTAIAAPSYPSPCLIESASVEYYADGIDDGHRVYVDKNVHPGDRYARPYAALEAAGKNPATSMHTTARTRPPDSRAGSRTPPCAIQPAPSRFREGAH